jgi:glutaredoxin-related protein
MKRLLQLRSSLTACFLVAALLCLPEVCQAAHISGIEFFGNQDADNVKIKTILPFQEGDEFDPAGFSVAIDKARQNIEAQTGTGPTDIAPVCCGEHGDWTIFIGLSGKTIAHHPRAKGADVLPEEALRLYDRFMSAVMSDVEKGASPEDDSQGFALSKNPSLREVQLEMRAFAGDKTDGLIKVLNNSADDRHRIVASQLLGYANRSQPQIAALINASHDDNDTVRNNATRAILVLATSSSDVAADIPPESFVEQLLSGTWTDVNKASSLLNVLTQSRKPATLTLLNSPEVRGRLIEVARWHTGHAVPAWYILGRIAGIGDDELATLVKDGRLATILAQLPAQP